MHELSIKQYISFQAARVKAKILAARLEKINKPANQIHHFISNFHLLSLAHTEPIKDFAPIFESDEKIDVISERFIHPIAKVTKGSSRHLIYDGHQLKGCGRNSLIQEEDELHSWGGLYLYDAIYAYLLGLYFDQSTDLGCIPYVSLSLYEPMSEKFSESKSILLREIDCYRLAQFNKDELCAIEKNILKNQITKFHQSEDINIICKKVIFHFAQLYLMNSVPFSLSMDNICLDGRIIDIEALNEFPSFEGEILILQVASSKENIENIDREFNVEHFEKMEIKFSNSESIFFHLFRLFEAYEDLFQTEIKKNWIIDQVKEIFQKLFYSYSGNQLTLLDMIPKEYYSEELFFSEIDDMVKEFYRKYHDKISIEKTILINVENSFKVMFFLPCEIKNKKIEHHFNLRAKNSVYYLACKFIQLTQLMLERDQHESVNVFHNSSQFNKLINNVMRVQPYKMLSSGEIDKNKYDFNQFLIYLNDLYKKEIIIDKWLFSVFTIHGDKKQALTCKELQDLLSEDKELVVYELKEKNEDLTYTYPTRPIILIESF